jgi:parvulin-like peptidyl-prolyl isomerase
LTEASARLDTAFANAWPAAVAAAEAGAIVGPTPQGKSYAVVQVLARKPARLDAATRAVIVEQVFSRWLIERRQQAQVQWHWV